MYYITCLDYNFLNINFVDPSWFSSTKYSQTDPVVSPPVYSLQTQTNLDDLEAAESLFPQALPLEEDLPCDDHEPHDQR